MLKKISVLLVVTCALTQGAHARTEMPLRTEGLYYEIGGGDAIRDTLTTASVLRKAISPKLKLRRSCDLWDGIDLRLGAYFHMVEEHIKDEVKRLPQQIVASMLGAAQGYATAALQRAMPGMYDWAMNINSQLSGRIKVAKVSCESALKDAQAGNNPFAGWVKGSGAFSWMNSLQSGFDEALKVGTNRNRNASPTLNILEAQDLAANAEGEADVPWLTGLAGGASEKPILLVNDTVIAGYALQAGSGNTAEGGTNADEQVSYSAVGGGYEERNQRLGELWKTADDAAAWANEVLGEQTISYCAECTGSTTAGKGLGFAAHMEKNSVVEAWNAILEQGDISSATIDELATVSSTKVQITQRVMGILDDMPPQDRVVFISRLASDVGTYRAVEKALAMRRLLQSSITMPEVMARPQAIESIEKLIAELKREVEDFMFEIETGKQLVSTVPAALIAYEDATNRRAVESFTARPQSVSTTVIRGQSAE